MQHLVIFSGAGISAESGLKTFRDSDGLWENYKVEEVATPEAWEKQPQLVLEFYNQRRKQVIEAKPNVAHQKVAELEKYFKVDVITQNIDNLHERAGSKHILYLHGELLNARSTVTDKTYRLKNSELNIGDKCEKGYQLRPDVVWFGESVPNMQKAIQICENADILVVIGTSLSVYPAAGLVHDVKPTCKIYLIDPKDVALRKSKNVTHLQYNACEGMNILFKELTKKN